MADETYYAWSPIKVGGKFNAETQAVEDVKTVNPGDTVSASDLGADEEQWQEYIDAGVVRPIAYPENVPQGMSVRDYTRQTLQEAGEPVETTGGTYLLTEVEQLEVARAAAEDIASTAEIKEEEVTPEEVRLSRMPITEGKDLSLPEPEAAPAATATTTAQTTTAS